MGKMIEAIDVIITGVERTPSPIPTEAIFGKRAFTETACPPEYTYYSSFTVRFQEIAGEGMEKQMRVSAARGIKKYIYQGIITQLYELMDNLFEDGSDTNVKSRAKLNKIIDEITR